MKPIIKTLAVAVVSLALATPVTYAQHRTSGNRGENREQSSHQQGNRAPAAGNRNDKHNKPQQNNNNGNKHVDKNRPNGNNDFRGPAGNHTRPAAPPPGNNHKPAGGNFRPGPAHNTRPAPKPHPAPRPGHNGPAFVHRPIHHAPWTRPVPPPAWRPRRGAPALSAVLGVTFGTALNVALNYLVNNGYTINSYGNNAVYLNNVNMFGVLWPEATMFYGNGGLERSEFYYSTPYPDMMRYNSLYSTLTRTYGVPLNIINNAAGRGATWFAPNRGYITLQYSQQFNGGAGRFFTTITTGL